jgi:3-oxoacyl-[acyl-carrier-protein] synthase III
MTTLGISDLAYAFAPQHDVIKDWGIPRGKSDELIKRMQEYRLRTYSRSADGAIQTLIDSAVRQLFERGSTHPREIDLVVYVHTLETSVLFPPADLIAGITRRFGLRCEGFSLWHQQCASTILALHLLPSLIAARRDVSTVLIVSADILFQEDIRCMDGITVASDAAAAMVLRRDWPHNKVIATELFTEGYNFDCWSRLRNSGFEDYTQFSAQTAASTLHQAMMRANVHVDDLALLIPYSGNIKLWETVCELSGIPTQKLYTPNVDRFGHAFSCDTIVNLSTSITEKAARTGDVVTLGALGTGHTYGFSVVEC